jgi:molecular chaperone GrpE
VSNQETTPIEDAENIQEQAAEQTNGELEAARKQAQDYFEGWQRERADFSNYKKRAERDLMTMRFNAKIDTLKSLLPVLDDFERAMANLPEDLRGQAWLEGIAAIQRKFLKTLEEHGVQTVDPTGDMFDPNLHEAIGKDSTEDVPSGHITVTLQKGYVAGDRVLRPALVRVAE